MYFGLYFLLALIVPLHYIQVNVAVLVLLPVIADSEILERLKEAHMVESDAVIKWTGVQQSKAIS